MAEMEKDLLRANFQEAVNVHGSGCIGAGSVVPDIPSPHCRETAATVRRAPTSAASGGLPTSAIGRVTTGFRPPFTVMKNLP